MVRPSRHSIAALISAFLLSLFTIIPATANNTAQTLPFTQNWAATGALLNVENDWSGVGGIVGFLGQDLTAATGTDPQTILGESSVAGDVDLIPNQTNTGITNGGVAEFEITDAVVALQGSGTADAPSLLFHFDTTGAANITVSYILRDIDPSGDNAAQQFALQYRVGSSGNFTNVPAGYVADATTGGSATQVTPVSAALPAEASNQPLIQVRVMTTNAASNDEWVGVDEISVVAGPDPEPTPTPTPVPTPTPTPLPTPTPTPAPAAIKVSQVYGGGGNAGATLKNDFIELHNPTGAGVLLDGWSVQYGAPGGTTWTPTELSGTIAAGGYYLIQEAAGTGGTLPLPDPDAMGNIAMGALNGKVALVHSTTALSGACPANPAIVDLIGYGTANCFEGAPTAMLSNTTAALRNGGGGVDTNNNTTDFTIGDPNPRAAKDSSPKVVTTFPTGGALGAPAYANIELGFNEPVNLTGSWFSIQCTLSGTHAALVSGGPVSFNLNPDDRFAGGESCTVTVTAANVTDVDADDPPDGMLADFSLSFTVAPDIACGPGGTLISAIQGTGATSPLNNTTVEIQGVVVGSYQGIDKLQGFHVQEEVADQDANPASSEGLFVFEPHGGAPAVAAGDVVRVRGRVSEFPTTGVSLTELGNLNNLEVCGSGAVVPPTDVDLPFADSTFGERYEGMLVSIDQELTVTETFDLGRFGEVLLSSGGRLQNPTNVVEPGPPALLLQGENDRRQILLDDGDGRQNIDPTVYPTGGLSASHTLRVGDTVDGGTFVFEQRFGVYRLQPTADLVDFDPTNPRPLAPEDVGGHVRVASFNVLNYFNGDGLGDGFPTARGAETQFEFERQRAKTVSALLAIDADIIGINELENDHGPQAAIIDLVDGLNAAGADTYAYIDTGIVGTDQIRVGMLYKPAVVTPVGAHAILTSAVDPRFIDTKSRPVLAQTFERNATGARFTVAANHLKSKGSACDDVGDPDAGDGQGNCNGTRTDAAEALVDWLATDPTGEGNGRNLIIGDLNSYAMEDPIDAITGSGYTNLIAEHIGEDAYSYVFDGQSGYLDHALANDELLAEVTDVTEWHINADEPTVMDYNTNFKSPGHVVTLYAPDSYRSSDHDPVIVGLVLAGSPTVDAGGPYEVIEGSSVELSATGTEPDGADLAYEWDLDGNGSYETSGQTVTFSAAGLQAPLSRPIGVRVTGPTGLTATDTATFKVIWDFGGFLGQNKERPAANTAKAGSNLTMRFDLDGDQGMAILAAGYPRSGSYTCRGTPLLDATEPTTGDGLVFSEASGQYSYAWKTDKAWANTCRTFVLKLADGTYHYVDVLFSK